VAYECGVLKIVVGEEELDVFCQVAVGMVLMVRGVTVIAEVEGVDWSLEVLR
jgi:hypothetical protein